MTYENAAYFKLLLLSGYKDELQEYIDNALIDQDPLSAIVLELSVACNDDNKILSVINEYLRKADDSDIDYDKSVFDLIMSFLKRKYVEDRMSMKNVTTLMYKIAVYTERYYSEPWQTMYHLGILFSEAEVGYIDKADYRRKFEAFINDGVCFCDYPPPQPKDSFIKRMLNKILRNR